jgi:hypothetical protein
MHRQRARTAHHQRLRAAEPEHLAPHRHHARKRELQSEREQQEHDADLGDGLRLRVRIGSTANAYGPSAMPTIR